MHAIDCAAKASLSSTRSRSLVCPPGARERLLSSGNGPFAHEVRLDARGRVRRRRARAASTPVAFTASSLTTSAALAPSLSGELLPAVTRAALAKDRGQLRERLERDVGARRLVLVEDEGLALLLRDRARRRSPRRRRPRAMAAPVFFCDATREGVLLLAGDLPLLGDVLGRLAHRLEREARRHLRVLEAPADRRVVDLRRRAREGLLGSSHRERRARHALDAAADGHVRVTVHTRMAAVDTASRPEPQRRFTVTAGTSYGSPARSTAMRATLRLSSPAWLVAPKTTWSSLSFAARRCARGAPRGRGPRDRRGATCWSAPLNLAMGVRTASTR